MEKRNVLFVDDDEQILNALKRVFLEEPYETLFAKSGDEALEILQSGTIQVIVTDMRMPQMNGLEFLGIVKDKYPHVIRLVLSGDTDIDTLLTAINQGQIFRFITKPWKSNQELKAIVRQAIQFYDIHNEREMLMDFFELWIEGIEPESVDIQFLRNLISTRKKHLYDWKRKCDDVPLNS